MCLLTVCLSVCLFVCSLCVCVQVGDKPLSADDFWKSVQEDIALAASKDLQARRVLTVPTEGPRPQACAVRTVTSGPHWAGAHPRPWTLLQYRLKYRNADFGTSSKAPRFCLKHTLHQYRTWPYGALG